MKKESADKAAPHTAEVGPISFWLRAWWQFCAFLCRVWFLCYLFRSYGRENLRKAWALAEQIDAARGAEEVVAKGRTGVLYLSNHQSMLDPIIIGLGLRHAFWAMARRTLWNSRLLGWMMDSLCAIPVNQARMDVGTLKACEKALKAGRPGRGLMIFPEGARTLSGQVEELKAGSMLILRKSRPVVVPVAIEGAYQVWPRGTKLPKPFGRIRMRFGEPIPPAALLERPVEEVLPELQEKLEAMRLSLQSPTTSHPSAN